MKIIFFNYTKIASKNSKEIFKLILIELQNKYRYCLVIFLLVFFFNLFKLNSTVYLINVKLI